MKAAVFQGPNRMIVEDVVDPTCGTNDIVLDVECCGICGSDLHSYVEGSFVEPGQIMGHEFSGVVSEVGAAVTGIEVGAAMIASPLSQCGACPRCAEGRGNLCEHGLSASVAYGLPGALAERVRVPNAVLDRNVFLRPASVTAVDGACVEPMAVALRLAKSAHPEPTDTAVVLGLGSIGLNIVQMLSALGAGRVIGIDTSPARRELAGKLGATDTVDAREQEPLSAVQQLTGTGVGNAGARADIVVEASGVPELFGQAVGMTRGGGRLRVAALYERPVAMDGNQIVQKELDVAGSFAYNGEFPEVLTLLEASRVHAEPLVTHVFPLDEVNEAFAAQLGKEQSVKALVKPRS